MKLTINNNLLTVDGKTIDELTHDERHNVRLRLASLLRCKEPEFLNILTTFFVVDYGMMKGDGYVLEL